MLQKVGEIICTGIWNWMPIIKCADTAAARSLYPALLPRFEYVGGILIFFTQHL